MYWIQIILLMAAVILCGIIRVPEYMCMVLLACSIIEVVLAVWRERKQENQVSQLIRYLTLVQDRLQLPELQTIKEGNLGILQSEIYKVVALLRETYSAECKQKKFLADMLSDISHQIKTPLTAISVMTDVLEQPELEDEKRLEYIAKIEKQVNKITWLIRNLLTLSQLEADVLVLKQETVNVYEMLEQIQDTCEIMAEVRQVALQMESDKKIVMLCDRHWTTEAISNIVKNCIEHTLEGGRVRLSVTQDNLATHIHIEDNGEGIAKKDLPHIFERFYKADSSSDHSIGIGLAMAKEIVQKQDGMIQVESKKGKGTKFHIKMYRNTVAD